MTIFARANNLSKYRLILWERAVSQLKSKYAGSRLGLWWAVITPLILAASINLVFTAAFKVEIRGYWLFVLSGILPWLSFNNAIMESTGSFVGNSSILKQGVFPREIVPVSSVISNMLNFMIGLAFMIPLFLINDIKAAAALPWLALIIPLQLLFMCGLGILFSCVNVYLRDTQHFLSSVFMVWFWITPVFYSLDMLPFPFRWICLLNPVTYFVVLYQDILFRAQAPGVLSLLAAAAISAVSIFAGHMFFIKNEASLLKKI